MVRIALGVEYDGTGFRGWQIQPDLRTVQDELQQALSVVADHSVNVICAGRTDTGVHATGQVVHFDTSSERTPRSWVLGVNSAVPKDVCVFHACEVATEFHARFSATERSYRYIIQNHQYRSALLHNRVAFEPRPLDAGIMHEAAQCLVGNHDFSAFRAAGCQAKSPQREIRRITVKRVRDFVIMDIAANAFLQNMVRIIAGVLMRVGRGEASVQWIDEILQDKDRRHRGSTASAAGLYLTDVVYPAGLGFSPSEGSFRSIFSFLD